MIAVNRNAALVVSGVLLLALVGCKAGEPPATSEDHAQTVSRDADTASVAAQPAMPSGNAGTTEPVELTHASDAPAAEPAEPAH